MSSKDKKFKTSIGGQALIEGVMMRGPKKAAMAVRKPDGELWVDVWDAPKKTVWSKIPIVRGVVNMVVSLMDGYKCLMKSAEISTEGLEEEKPSKFEEWLEKKLGDKMTKVVSVLSAILGIAFAVLLFTFLPAFLVGFLKGILPRWGLSLIEGFLKIALFVGYLAVVSLLPDMKRMFQYHGAEHKTIFCYEAGLELTVENVRKQKRFHPRCGTSFLIIALILSILVFSVVTWSSPLIRTLLKLALTPIVVGIAYELIKLAGRYDNVFTRILSFPGLKLQHLTTREPDDSMIEAAIASVKPVIPEKKGEDQW